MSDIEITDVFYKNHKSEILAGKLDPSSDFVKSYKSLLDFLFWFKGFYFMVVNFFVVDEKFDNMMIRDFFNHHGIPSSFIFLFKFFWIASSLKQKCLDLSKFEVFLRVFSFFNAGKCSKKSNSKKTSVKSARKKKKISQLKDKKKRVLRAKKGLNVGLNSKEAIEQFKIESSRLDRKVTSIEKQIGSLSVVIKDRNYKKRQSSCYQRRLKQRASKPKSAKAFLNRFFWSKEKKYDITDFSSAKNDTMLCVIGFKDLFDSIDIYKSYRTCPNFYDKIYALKERGFMYRLPSFID
jgi:hypothetical protein